MHDNLYNLTKDKVAGVSQFSSFFWDPLSPINFFA